MKLSFRARPLPRVSRKLWRTLLIASVLTVSFALYVYWEKRIDRANDLRQISYQLADELRQSSDGQNLCGDW